MNITISNQFTDDIKTLSKEDKKLGMKIWELVVSIIENHAINPLEGLGKPEALKHDFRGYYSRRITDTHRLIYSVKNDTLFLLSCYGHYNDK